MLLVRMSCTIQSNKGMKKWDKRRSYKKKSKKEKIQQEAFTQEKKIK